MNLLNFTALDFETATSKHSSICQIGIVVVENGVISRKYSALIKPPHNQYSYHNIKVHKIEPFMTENAPVFLEIWPEIANYISGKHIVCHNASFDLTKLEETLIFYDLPIPQYSYSCTYKLFGGNLQDCCHDHGINFINHHDALADAEACACLYLKHLEKGEKKIIKKDDTPFASKKVEKADLIPNFDIQDKDNPFYQKKVVFTGDLISFSRMEAAHKIKLLGADVNTSISKKTDFVIIGRNPGPSKLDKVKKLGVPIISEDEFLKMVE